MIGFTSKEENERTGFTNLLLLVYLIKTSSAAILFQTRFKMCYKGKMAKVRRLVLI